MKKMNKIVSVLLAVVMVLAMSVTTMAQTVDVNNGEGSITIENAAQGKDYSIYKLFDATYSADGISYKVPEGKEFTGNAWFNVDTAGNVLAVEGADIATDEFKTWAESFGTQVGTTVTADDNTVVFANIPYGYYFIKSTLGGTITVNSTNPDAIVIDKNETAPIINEEEFKTVGDETAQLGDDVEFKIEFVATNYVTENERTTQITEYTIIDEPTALAIKEDTIAVKINDTDLTTNDNVSISVDANGKMTIILTWAEEANAEGVQKTIYPYASNVEITYTATVTNAGVDTEGIKNSATISYNDTEKDTEVVVDTYQITINKIDSEENGLTGAQFELYREDSEEAVAVVDITEEGATVRTYRVATTEDTTTTTTIKAYVGELDDNTAVGYSVIIKGLDGADTYELKEIKAPDGYNILTSNVGVDMGNEDQTEDIINVAGTILPSTGGMGTTILYVVGGILVVAAVVLLFVKRRVEEN